MSRILVTSLVAVMLSAASLDGQQADADINGQHPWTLDDIIAAVEEEPKVELGVLEGNECEVFGSITDATVDGGGRIFVLDAQSHAVTGFDSEGECLFRVGRQGRGPGEFTRPRRIALSDEGVLFVLDAGNARIERFDVAGSEAERLSAIPLRAQAADLCHLDDRLFVAVMQADEAIHEIGEDGDTRARFGSLHESDIAAVRAIASPEIMLCHHPTGSIVLAARHMPAVHRYTSAGELAFAGDFPGFVRADLVERDGRVRGYRPSSEGLHYAISAVPLASSVVLLQSGPPRDVNRMFGQVNSARFDLEAGALAPVDEALPYVLAARGRWLVAAPQAEFPRIGIWRHPEEGAR